ncbi:MAG TPA: type II secretion system protein [Gemmatimonadales bacterium]
MMLRPRGEHGFTMLELMIVIMVIALMMAISFPKLGDSLSKQGVRGASDAIRAMHATARAAAVQSGRGTTLRFDGNLVYVLTADPVSGVLDTVGTVQDLMASYKATITVTNASFRFDARGIGRESDSTYIQIVRDSNGDDLVITPWGQIR